MEGVVGGRAVNSSPSGSRASFGHCSGSAAAPSEGVPSPAPRTLTPSLPLQQSGLLDSGLFPSFVRQPIPMSHFSHRQNGNSRIRDAPPLRSLRDLGHEA